VEGEGEGEEKVRRHDGARAGMGAGAGAGEGEGQGAGPVQSFPLYIPTSHHEPHPLCLSLLSSTYTLTLARALSLSPPPSPSPSPSLSPTQSLTNARTHARTHRESKPPAEERFRLIIYGSVEARALKSYGEQFGPVMDVYSIPRSNVSFISFHEVSTYSTPFFKKKQNQCLLHFLS